MGARLAWGFTPRHAKWRLCDNMKTAMLIKDSFSIYYGAKAGELTQSSFFSSPSILLCS